MRSRSLFGRLPRGRLADASRPVALPPRANHPLLLDANASAPFISALSGFSWSVCTNEHVGEHDVSLLDAEQLSKFKKYCDSVYSLSFGKGQKTSMEDYIELSCMLQYNYRT